MTIVRRESNSRLSRSVTFGNLVFLAGQVPSAAASSLTEQTWEVLRKVEALLVEANSSKRHLLSVSIWLADITQIEEMNSVWEQWAEPGHLPARATVEAKLASPNYLIEVSAIAAVTGAPGP